MSLLSYDGSIEGLFSVIAVVMEEELEPSAICAAEKMHCGDLFAQPRHITTDEERVHALLQKLKPLCDRRTFRQILYVYFSEDDEAALLICRYVLLLLERNAPVYSDLTHPVVNRFHRLARKVSRECHRYQGLLRFEAIRDLDDEVLLGCFAPDHNLVALLMPYFCERMASEAFILYDIRRNFGMYHRGGDVFEVCFPRQTRERLRQFHRLHVEPDRFEELWRRYFQSASIESRYNPRLQRNIMPRKYWSFLTEMSGE
ncbi:MAG: DNA metabolism protein [Lentisphaerae bacterium]|nr:MAG: DNA metabolism protein [Lentisphaerota bacterium]